MKPQSGLDQGVGGKQKRDSTGKTVPVSSIPLENRREEGVTYETPEEARRPGVTDPKIKEDRPGQNEITRRGLHR